MTAKADASSSSPRDRLLAAADVLFYGEGIHATGIDRVLESAGVAKASLYAHFGSKDALVAAYLDGRAVRRQARIAARLATLDTPRDKILGVFTLAAEIAAEPGFRGCAFVNANGEGDLGEAGRAASLASRASTRGLFIDLARAAGAADAEAVGGQLHLLYDGAAVRASIERDARAPLSARDAAAVLLDAALAPTSPRKKKRSRNDIRRSASPRRAR